MYDCCCRLAARLALGLAVLAGVPCAAIAAPVEVSFMTGLPEYAPAGQQDFQASSYTTGGVTLSGSANVFFYEANGAGIVGDDNYYVDGSEFIDVFFAPGPVLDVEYFISVAFDDEGDVIFGERVLEAFAAGGGSLGTVWHDHQGWFSVSSLFGNVPIEGFSLTAPGFDGFRLGAVRFTPAAESTDVPEPASLGILAVGLFALAGLRRRPR